MVENSLVGLTHVRGWRDRLLFLVAGWFSSQLRLCHLLFRLRHVLHDVRGLQLGHLVVVQQLLVLLWTWLGLRLVVTLRRVVVDDSYVAAVIFGFLILDYIILLRGLRHQ